MGSCFVVSGLTNKDHRKRKRKRERVFVCECVAKFACSLVTNQQTRKRGSQVEEASKATWSKGVRVGWV